MKLKQLFTDDSAVSPVIGVILMVAITVILAAVIGTFVLNLGGSVSQTTPQASFGFDYNDADNNGNWDNNDTITVTHESGASIDAARLTIVVDGNQWNNSDFNNWSGQVSAGSSESINHDNDIQFDGGDKVLVTWSSENQENSATLSEGNVPNN